MCGGMKHAGSGRRGRVGEEHLRSFALFAPRGNVRVGVNFVSVNHIQIGRIPLELRGRGSLGVGAVLMNDETDGSSRAISISCLRNSAVESHKRRSNDDCQISVRKCEQ